MTDSVASAALSDCKGHTTASPRLLPHFPLHHPIAPSRHVFPPPVIGFCPSPPHEHVNGPPPPFENRGTLQSLDKTDNLSVGLSVSGYWFLAPVPVCPSDKSRKLTNYYYLPFRPAIN
ncbi:uncharacterized protein BO97DRAFT_211165 [Aspergillus homomorphus CBS 101889]|uniref:Uncharacterized protein n=1 Tax=Aspergillus homomorphus (strain CBS 101889) TaxID=1450537 RepID=A0A395I6L1_ASPHC|nr:hypothetical protein BO97DRAFT_211165 [Aspergillus homomorphus CBS 101889]RAL15409.1 hypothetical protein BO97DRAFT_211165 [Aspergillus homomorphus CBS 101889]